MSNLNYAEKTIVDFYLREARNFLETRNNFLTEICPIPERDRVDAKELVDSVNRCGNTIVKKLDKGAQVVRSYDAISYLSELTKVCEDLGIIASGKQFYTENLEFEPIIFEEPPACKGLTIKIVAPVRTYTYIRKRPTSERILIDRGITDSLYVEFDSAARLKKPNRPWTNGWNDE
ncbi:hypothetical protein JXA85_08325 [Candidatus Woesearchaeota archaeon]|nr:hypothetical protein [Candidatus Woesearchaeota archaeon]